MDAAVWQLPGVPSADPLPVLSHAGSGGGPHLHRLPVSPQVIFPSPVHTCTHLCSQPVCWPCAALSLFRAVPGSGGCAHC